MESPRILSDFAATGQITPNFNLREFCCRGPLCCGNVAPISFYLVNLLQDLRDAVKGPLRVSSGFRCRIHNANEKGSPTSLHMYGLAADLHRRADLDTFSLYQAAKRHPFRRVYCYDWGIHVDIRYW